jgi:flagellar M-ring protein FliF
VVVVGGLYAATTWMNQKDWAPLLSDVEPTQMQAAIKLLKDRKLAYQLDPGGRTVRVEASRLDELRMDMAAAGMFTGPAVGFELFDQTQFGATELTEQVQLRRALEGELSRTIMTLAPVASARVHVTLARNSLFAQEGDPAKASVAVRIKPGQSLSAAEIDGIISVVSSSVEGLKPEGVVVVDHLSRRLSRQIDASEGPLDRGRFERQQQLERDLAQRVVALLEPVVGEGRVRANISASLRADMLNETEERWDPTSVVRSKQQTSETDGRPGVGGVAGARSNMPPTADGQVAEPANSPAPSFSTNNRTSETTNYEVSKLTRHRVSPAGQLSRLSVAVLIDDIRKVGKDDDGKEVVTTTQRTPEELQRLHALVASAVGLDPERGDQLTVENIAFDTPYIEEPVIVPPPVPAWQVVFERLQAQWRIVVPSVLGVLAILGLWIGLRGRKRRKLAATAAAAMSGPRLATVGGAPEPGPSRPVGFDEPDDLHLPPNPARQLARLAQHEPEQLARIVRGWLAEEDRDR